MASTPAPKNTVHWAPSPVLSTLSDSSSSASTSSISSTSTLQYINGQLLSHGFAVPPGLCLDGISSADAESVTKCLLSMLGQRVEDLTRAEDLTTKLRTLSYDYERLRTMHGAATETAESAEREAAAARAKLTIAKRAQEQAEAMHKQTTGDLQRARTALQALRATHVAEIKRREMEIEGMRERWSKLSDAQLRIGTMPSGMTVGSSCLQPANASTLVRWSDTTAGGDAAAQKGRPVHDVALEEAEKACTGLREQNGELKALVVDAANAVRKILHKALSPDPDDLEFPPPLATIDIFPLGAPDAAFERLSGLLTSLRDALATLRTCDALPAAGTASTLGSNPKPQISLADLAKKAAESDAKAHKWEVEELRATIASLRDELRKVKGERKSAPGSRMQDVPVAQDKLASYLPPNEESAAGPALEPQHDQLTNSEPDRVEQNPQRKRDLLVSTKPEMQRNAAPPAAAPQPGPSRLSPRKTRSKSKTKSAFKSPLKTTKRASASAKRTTSGSRPRRLTSGLTGKRVEASFETEVKPSAVAAVSLLPTSFVLPPPSPESRPPPHIGTLFTPSVPLQLIPSSTTPPFSPLAQPPPPAPSNPTTAPPEREETRAVASEVIFPSVAQPLSSIPQPPTSKPFQAAKPQARKISHAYSPAKPSPLSRILTLADFPESMPTAAPTSVAPPPAPHFNPDPLYPPGAFASAAVPVFEQPPIHPPIVVPTLSHVPVLAPVTSTNNTNLAPAPPPAPAPVPLRTGSTSNAAGTGASSQRRRKRTSREAELDLDADPDTSKAKSKSKSKSKANANDARSNSKSAAAEAEAGGGMDVDSSDAAPTRDPRAPEKENTITRRLKGGPAAVAKTRGSSGGSGVKTRKMAANAAKSGASKSSAPAAVPGPAPVVLNELPPATEGTRVGGAAGRLLAAVRGGGGGIGPRHIPIDSTVVGIPARRVS